MPCPASPPTANENASPASDAALLFGLTRVTELLEGPDGHHGQVVAHLAHRLALKAGHAAAFAGEVLQVAALHDVGKIAVPWEILLKPGPLLPAERRIVETHAALGATILRSHRISHLSLAQDIAQHHHERWDGNGYPCRLSGERIALAARIVAIVAIVDVCDALLSERCYKPAWSPAQTLAYLLRQRGTAFDPDLLQLFVADYAGMLELREEIRAPEAAVPDELAA